MQSITSRAAFALRPTIFASITLLGCANEPTDNHAPTAQGAQLPADQIAVTGDATIDPATGRIDANLTYRFRPQARVEHFLINGGLEIEVSGHAVESVSTEASDMNSEWNRLSVALAETAEHEEIQILFRIEGAPNLPSNGINQISPEGIELSVDTMWQPLIESIDRLFVATIDLALPPGWAVISSGETVPSNGRVRLHNTIPQVDIAFSATPILDRAEEGHYSLYHRGAPHELVDKILQRANRCRDELDGRFGADDPLPAGRFVMTDRREGGYARKNYVVLSDVSDMADPELTNFLCHELAHYWASKGKAFMVDNWLNEGFAELVATQSLRRVHDEATYNSAVESLEDRAAGLGSIWTPDDLSRRSYGVQYKKAPVALLQLEEHIGPDQFEVFVRRTLSEVSSTPELLDLLEQLAGTETRAWFQGVLAMDHRSD